jgi:hypothetical protein
MAIFGYELLPCEISAGLTMFVDKERARNSLGETNENPGFF